MLKGARLIASEATAMCPTLWKVLWQLASRLHLLNATLEKLAVLQKPHLTFLPSTKLVYVTILQALGVRLKTLLRLQPLPVIQWQNIVLREGTSAAWLPTIVQVCMTHSTAFRRGVLASLSPILTLCPAAKRHLYPLTLKRKERKPTPTCRSLPLSVPGNLRILYFTKENAARTYKITVTSSTTHARVRYSTLSPLRPQARTNTKVTRKYR